MAQYNQRWIQKKVLNEMIELCKVEGKGKDSAHRAAMHVSGELRQGGL